jgi:ribosomal protein L35
MSADEREGRKEENQGCTDLCVPCNVHKIKVRRINFRLVAWVACAVCCVSCAVSSPVAEEYVCVMPGKKQSKRKSLKTKHAITKKVKNNERKLRKARALNPFAGHRCMSVCVCVCVLCCVAFVYACSCAVYLVSYTRVACVCVSMCVCVCICVSVCFVPCTYTQV